MATAKKLPSGSYRVNLYIGKDANGKRKYKSFTAKTKKAAEYLAAQYNQLKKENSSDSMLLRAAAENYINIKENVMSSATIRSYRAILRNDVPQLMNTKLKDINQQLVQSVFNSFAADHSSKTCRNVHGLISAVLKMYRPELVLNTTMPPRLRASEISGLETSAVHSDCIEIKQARVRSERGEALKTPKSYSGFRRVPISPSLRDFLLTHSVDERVCPHSSDWITHHWSAFRGLHDLPKHLNFHALRHYFPSRCLLMGMPQKYIAEIMGHSSVNMIEKVYQHTFPSAMEQYAQQLREQSEQFMQHKMQHKNM